jgi:Probable cobalt transporter subunit (CbtB)
MTDVIASSPQLGEVIHPPAISLREVAPWALFAMALLALVYFVGVDQGAASIVPGNLIHEFVHDGRHLLGFPCH